MGVETGHNLHGNIERTVHRNQESNENEANMVLDCRRVSFDVGGNHQISTTRKLSMHPWQPWVMPSRRMCPANTTTPRRSVVARGQKGLYV